MQTFELHIASTGELVKCEQTDRTLVSWQKRIEKKLLRYKRTPDRVKEAIRGGDTIAGWADSDEYRFLVSPAEFEQEIRRVFRGYDRWFETRMIS